MSLHKVVAGLNFYTESLKIILSSARACQGWAETTFILHQGSLEKKESSVVSFTFLTSSALYVSTFDHAPWKIFLYKF